MATDRRSRESATLPLPNWSVECPPFVGPYRLLAPIGQGGMGVVYEAEDTQLGRRVAVKLVPREPRPDARLSREARLASLVNHPNVVALYDTGAYPGGIYLVMELVAGASVQSLLQTPLSWRRATKVAIAAASGLMAVHECGIIHSDIKPSNLLRTADGIVKLTDFGLAQSLDPEEMALTWTKNAGTPHYMSPEQCRHEELDERTDIYSLGATYYTLFTGQTPFAAQSAMMAMFAHCAAPVPDPRAVRPELPKACAAIVRISMAKARSDRFATAAEMRHALVKWWRQAPM